MNILITGGAGFIGSYICRRLCKEHRVIVVDNLILGKEDNIKELYSTKNIVFFKGDVSETIFLENIIKENNIDLVIHLAANSDIKKGGQNPDVDFNNTFLTTYSVLEGMRKNNVKNLVFASTSAIYGDKRGENINEDSGPLFPISYYGGAKLASEALISSYTYMNNMSSCIVRFPNVIGENLTHGVVFDFIKKLKKNEKELEILGDGNQQKSYIYIQDLIDAIICVFKNRKQGINYYNIGSEGVTTVREIADMVCEEMNLKNVKYKFTGGECGWLGDVPKFRYDINKINNLGWHAKYSSNDAVRLAVKGAIKLCK